jgi:predicted methyltransferase MtxX (methanogen marker protein 4)
MDKSINYATIRETLQALDVARAHYNRIASTQIGVISGGIDLSEDGREIDRLCETGFALVEAAIESGARLSHLAAVIAEYGATSGIQDLIRNAQSEAEYRRRPEYSR